MSRYSEFLFFVLAFGLAIGSARRCQKNEYQCPNEPGHCIPMEWLCDLMMDCIDGSDELNCGSIEATEQQSMDYLSGSNIVALAVVVAVLIIFIIVDTTCCLTKRVGAIAWICTRTCGKSNHEKISEENNGTDKSPLLNVLEERETAPMINGNNEKKVPVSNSVESLPDMKKSASKTSVAKDSIV
ncbi:hypothetical protein QYM36_015127 [Artemia franciscana]|uniref:Uncharacterized protein n=2 Tax=Artemia franciscana TaxID=6661 RepID=A0AA88H8I7_ARTSF|nr:hypothetical protein QYM36_015127 [Artemia franciscana]